MSAERLRPPEQSRLQDEPLSFTEFTKLFAYQSVLSAARLSTLGAHIPDWWILLVGRYGAHFTSVDHQATFCCFILTLLIRRSQVTHTGSSGILAGKQLHTATEVPALR